MNTEQYNQCVEQYADRLFRFAFSSLRNREQAEDVVQESFARVWEKLKTVEFAKAKSYLFTTTHHAMVDEVRQRQHFVSTEDYAHVEEKTTRTPYPDVNTILHNLGFTHPQNKLHKGGIYLFDDYSGIRYPDFYKEDIVLDAKYKRLGSYDKVSKVGGDDLHQVIAYLSPLHATRGGFVAPLEQPQTKVPTSHLKGKDATLSIFGIEISKTASSYLDFCEQMRTMEEAFVESLNQSN